jgi:hypothetical protein
MSNGSRQNIPPKPTTNGRSSVNGYKEIDNGRKNKYVEVLNEQSANGQSSRDEGVKCPFDAYEIGNRKMYERLFGENTD